MDKETLINLIEFLKECEYRIENIKEKDVTVWVDFYDLKELTEILGYNEFCEGGVEVILLYENIAFNLYDLLYGIADDDDWEIIINQLGGNK